MLGFVFHETYFAIRIEEDDMRTTVTCVMIARNPIPGRISTNASTLAEPVSLMDA